MRTAVRMGFVRFACIAAILVPAAPAFAQDPLELDPQRPKGPTGDWGLAVTPYGWFAAQSTDVGTKQLRQSFSDLASIVNVGFQGRLLARWRWLLFAADWTYADLGMEQVAGPVDIDADIRQNIVDMKLGGLVYDTRKADLTGGIGIWAAAGARYWENKVDVDVVADPVLPGGSGAGGFLADTQEWWDPVLGVTLQFPVTPAVGFIVRTTGGGFGIGNASTYLWDAEMGATFRVSRRLRVDASNRQFKYNRTDGEGDAAVEQTVSVVGPSIGLSLGLF